MPTVGAIVAAAGSGSRLGRGSKALVRHNGRTTLARVLGRAFDDDPIQRWAFPRAGIRARYGHRFFRWSLWRCAEQQVSWTETAIDRIVKGKIVENWINEDALGRLQQLGALPTPGCKFGNYIGGI